MVSFIHCVRLSMQLIRILVHKWFVACGARVRVISNAFMTHLSKTGHLKVHWQWTIIITHNNDLAVSLTSCLDSCHCSLNDFLHRWHGKLLQELSEWVWRWVSIVVWSLNHSKQMPHLATFLELPHLYFAIDSSSAMSFFSIICKYNAMITILVNYSSTFIWILKKK